MHHIYDIFYLEYDIDNLTHGIICSNEWLFQQNGNGNTKDMHVRTIYADYLSFGAFLEKYKQCSYEMKA